ncbi:MAG: 4'-phosphopantetheinyl transferase superfamily protein [Alphaproteobacteria bacterium]
MLQQGEVHLCLMPLAQPASVIEELATMLTPDEHERASRFHFDRDRRRFIVARGLLRQLLGRYLGAPGDALRFEIGPFGKPSIAAGAQEAKLEFSLSHSGDWALAGITRGRGLGVDLEEVRAMTDHSELARSNFAPAEAEALLMLPEDQQIDGFFACWTRKEAYVKALGLGLSLDLASFVVSVEPTEIVEIVPASQDAGAHHMWGMRPLAGFWAAVAIETSNASMDFPRMRQVTHPGLAT